jgi:RNA polymerase sigma factor (sigma-70 family)
MPDGYSSAELRRLRRALDTMPADARAVFHRHLYRDKPYEVIAAELGIDIAEVERLMAQAMIHLVREAEARDPGGSARFGAWLRVALRPLG